MHSPARPRSRTRHRPRQWRSRRRCAEDDIAHGVADQLDGVIDALDLRHGRRGWNHRGMDASLDAMACDVLDLMDVQGWSSVMLLGHSMGARVAIRATARDARRISSSSGIVDQRK